MWIPAVGIGILLMSFTSKKRSARGDGMLGQYFSFDELVNSPTCEAHGIPNVPNEDQVTRAILLTEHILDPLRECLGGPLKVNSWLRVEDCNEQIGGVPDSVHLTGGAADLDYAYEGSPRNDLIMRCLLSYNLPFDRVLLEAGDWRNPNWIHVEYDGDKSPGEQRQQIWVMNNGPHGYILDRATAEETFL